VRRTPDRYTETVGSANESLHRDAVGLSRVG